MQEYRVYQDSDKEQMIHILQDAFGAAREGVEEWMSRAPVSRWRVLEDERVQGCLLRIPMAQYYGGRTVSATGVAGVAIDDRARGLGAGQQLMKSLLSELRDEGCALSALYASTCSFYRKNGYEKSGARFLATLNIRELNHRGGPLKVRPLDDSHDQLIRDFYAKHRRQDACLVRNDYLWKRIRFPRGRTARGYGFFDKDELHGYTYLVRKSSGLSENSFEATDVVLTTPEATDTFLGFLAGHRALFQTTVWPTSPNSPVFFKLRERWNYDLRLDEHWMLRITHLEEALKQRGYPEQLEAELHLEVEDPVLPENSGRFCLRLSQGRATVEPGGRGDVRLDVGGLAALYTGFSSAENLAVAGRAQGSPEFLALASRIFVGAPEMTDFF